MRGRRIRALSGIMAATVLLSLGQSEVHQAAAATAGGHTVNYVGDENELRIWYTAPAPIDTYAGWESLSLPLGNSSIGCNVFGGISRERLQLNEKTFWSGGPSENREYNGGNLPDKGNYGQTMKDIQQAFREGNTAKANQLCENLTGVSDDYGTQGYGYYLSYGNMYLDFSGMTEARAQNYVRDLDLNTAVSRVEYDYENAHYSRETFISFPDNVLVTRVTSSIPGKLNFDVKVETDNTPGNAAPNENKAYQRSCDTTITDHRIMLEGEITDNQMKYNSQTVVLNEGGGSLTDDTANKKVVVKGVDSVVIITAIGTDYKNEYPHYRTGATAEAIREQIKQRVDAAKNKGYAELKDRHVTDYQSIFHRLKLDLGQNPSDIPTDELLKAYNAGSLAEDKKRALEVMLYQYGRYLTIASSRGDTLPSNLQGIWVGGNDSAWHSDYHLNVNLQMNYWPVYSGNMAECALPLIDYVDSLRKPGRVTADIYAGIKSTPDNPENGFMAHTQNNPFGWTCPGWKFNWGWSPAAVPWILQNCWEYYEYTGDLEFMKKKIYPMMKEETKLYSQMLIPDSADGERLICSPAYSPEHGPRTNGNTYEQTLIWQLFEDTITAGELVGEDTALLESWRNTQSKLKGPIEIGESGQIKEWYEETIVNQPGMGEGYNHRHMSHLLGLFPGDYITVDKPDLINAAIVSLQNRTDKSTGWGMGQRINTWARVGDGNKAYKLIGDLFRSGILTNLWDTHAPFQIDGNFGYTSGVNEMLMQSNAGYINILPALPDAWTTGNVQGLVARGNFEVDIDWVNKTVSSVSLHSRNGGKAVVHHPGISRGTVRDSRGNLVDFEVLSADRISFDTAQGTEYIIEDIPSVAPAS